MTHPLRGLLTVAVGLFVANCGTLRREFVLDRLIAARPRHLWGDGVHRFFQASGTPVVMGVRMAPGIA